MMSENIVQHHEFAAGFAAFEKYVKDCSDSTSEERFQADKFRGLIDGFAPKLTVHLADEINTLLGLDKYDEKKVHQVYVDFEKTIKEGKFNKACIISSLRDLSIKSLLTVYRRSCIPSFLDRTIKVSREEASGLQYRHS
jgi:hypothetical protein